MIKYITPFIIAVLGFTSCLKDDINTTSLDKEGIAIDNLEIPRGFKFETKKEIDVLLKDANPSAIYQVYAWNDDVEKTEVVTFENDLGEIETDTVFTTDVLNQLLFTASAGNGIISRKVTVPNYYTHLYVRRKLNGMFSSQIVEIESEAASFTYIEEKGASMVQDMLFCVNSTGQLFTVEPSTGNLTELGDLPENGGSITCAIDNANKVMYTIISKNNNPLYKYDILSGEWTKIRDLGFNGPRLGYNKWDGFLYFSANNNKNLVKIDPLTGLIISTEPIVGLNKGGGDLAFRDDGELYLCTFAGLYHLTNDGEQWNAKRISGNDLPFSPTSMTFDKNNELWVASNDSESSLIVMDTETGGYEYRWGTRSPEGTDTQINRKINDLATLLTYAEDPEPLDTDEDGIPDSDDAYPEDADKAFEQYTPSKYGWGTHAFEDLWPNQGDYDFNDVAVGYKIVTIANADNEVVKIDFHFNVKNNGAGYVNGYGIQLQNISPGDVKSVSGYMHKHDYIQLASNGTEEDQLKAVIIPFDDTQYALGKDLVVEVEFKYPISFNRLGDEPFDPFMIVNSTRDREVHLPLGNPTTLGKRYTSDDPGANGSEAYYLTNKGMPWAIDIVHDFNVPKEKVPVNRAYRKFNSWAESGGSSYSDWYKDNDGYRDESCLK